MNTTPCKICGVEVVDSFLQKMWHVAHDHPEVFAVRVAIPLANKARNAGASAGRGVQKVYGK